ncbi:MAG: hypothetical protein AAFN74_26185, partial [Myxococcota bacterium]
MNFKKKYLVLMPALLLAGFVACSDDDDPPTPMANNNNNTAPMPSLQQQAVDNGQVVFSDGTGLTIEDSLAIDISATSIAAPTVALPAGLDDAAYYGAVDPAAADGWWESWAVRDGGIDGNLPGDDFHPLEDEIRAGTITPSATNECANLDANYRNGGTVTIFEAVFPVSIVET